MTQPSIITFNMAGSSSNVLHVRLPRREWISPAERMTFNGFYVCLDQHRSAFRLVFILGPRLLIISVDGIVNMKYTLGYCLYGVDNKDVPVLPDTCTNECSSLSYSLLDRVKQTNTSIQYQYCSSTAYGDNSFMNGVDGCSSCLSSVGNQTYLSNCMSWSPC